MRYITTLFTPKRKADVPHSGGIYTPEWACKLFRGLDRNGDFPDLYVVTDWDEFKRDTFPVPFKYHERDWSSNMEKFRPDVVGPEGAIILDLDTIVVGDLAPLEAACRGRSCVVALDPYRKPEICLGATWVSQEKAEEVWSKWEAGRDEYLQDERYFFSFGQCPEGRFSEMLWLREHLTFDDTWDALLPGAVQSYKVDLNKGEPDEDTILVYFHGDPKPHQVNHPWVREHWR